MTRPGALGFAKVEPTLIETSPRRLVLAICDANPILADRLCRILQDDELLSGRFQILIAKDVPASLRPIAPDILIFDPTQDASPQQDWAAMFEDLPNRCALIGYCNDIAAINARSLMSSGFRAVIPKTVHSAELVRVVSAVSFNGVYLHESFAENATERRQLRRPGPPVSLTQRESEVLRQVALGSSLKEIAAALKLSTKTVDTYKTRANRKLDLRSRSDIVRFAIQSGWMKDAPLPLQVEGRY